MSLEEMIKGIAGKISQNKLITSKIIIKIYPQILNAHKLF